MTISDKETNSENSPVWIKWFAHHVKSECDDKCFKIGFGRKIYVCSRCSGLYPAMFLWIFIDFYFNFGFSLRQRSEIFAVLLIPGWLHWAAEALKNRVCISKYAAFLTALPSGAGVGALLVGHFRHPYNSSFLSAVFLLSVFSGAIIFLKRFFHG